MVISMKRIASIAWLCLLLVAASGCEEPLEVHEGERASGELTDDEEWEFFDGVAVESDHGYEIVIADVSLGDCEVPDLEDDELEGQFLGFQTSVGADQTRVRVTRLVATSTRTSRMAMPQQVSVDELDEEKSKLYGSLQAHGVEGSFAARICD